MALRKLLRLELVHLLLGELVWLLVFFAHERGLPDAPSFKLRPWSVGNGSDSGIPGSGSSSATQR